MVRMFSLSVPFFGFRVTLPWTVELLCTSSDHNSHRPLLVLEVIAWARLYDSETRTVHRSGVPQREWLWVISSTYNSLVIADTAIIRKHVNLLALTSCPSSSLQPLPLSLHPLRPCVRLLRPCVWLRRPLSSHELRPLSLPFAPPSLPLFSFASQPRTS